MSARARFRGLVMTTADWNAWGAAAAAEDDLRREKVLRCESGNVGCAYYSGKTVTTLAGDETLDV